VDKALRAHTRSHARADLLASPSSLARARARSKPGQQPITLKIRESDGTETMFKVKRR